MNWGCLIIAVTGVAALSTPITIENVIHVENIPRFSAVSQATPAAKYNVAALAGASNAQSKTNPSALDSEKPLRKKSAISAALQGLGVAGRGMSYHRGFARNAGRNPFGAGQGSAGRASIDGIRNNVSSGML